MSDKTPESFEQVVTLLGERELAEGVGASRHQPRDWRIRKSIPPEWWGRVVTYANRHGHKQITAALLAELAEARRNAPPTEKAKASAA